MQARALQESQLSSLCGWIQICKTKNMAAAGDDDGMQSINDDIGYQKKKKICARMSKVGHAPY
jgi:hypothetical protein